VAQSEARASAAATQEDRVKRTLPGETRLRQRSQAPQQRRGHTPGCEIRAGKQMRARAGRRRTSRVLRSAGGSCLDVRARAAVITGDVGPLSPRNVLTRAGVALVLLRLEDARVVQLLDDLVVGAHLVQPVG
jgi:hypothetical protein